ncbi:MAG: hypothetical protein V1913_05265 [Fibrobacterota bacterium]
MKKITIVLLAALLTVPALAGNTSLGIKSAILPGMGQLAAGSGSITSKNTLKGLGFLTGFTLCMHGLVNNISLKESYAEQTDFYSRRLEAIKKSGNFEDAEVVSRAHKAAYDDYESANTAVYVFLGLSVAVYAYGVVDALLFTQEESTQEGPGGAVPASSLHLPENVNVQVARNNGRSNLVVKYSF